MSKIHLSGVEKPQFQKNCMIDFMGKAPIWHIIFSSEQIDSDLLNCQ